MREIKMKVWVDNERMIGPFDLSQNPNYWAHELEDGERLLYTGLKDKNGVEVYEGDIIKRSYSGGSLFTGEVHWDEGTYFVRKFDEYAFLFSQYEREEVEVIGNIYEHAHLLEGEEN